MSSASEGSLPQHGHTVYTGDEIDLRQLARAIWRYRWVVIVVTALGTAGGLIASLISTKYLAEGLFLAPSLSIASFKQYEVALGNEQRMRRFIELSAIDGTQSEQLLNRLVTVPGALSKTVSPAFSITSREAKEYDVKFEESGLIGVRLLVERDEISAESPIQRLADYVRHTMIDIDLRDVLLTQCLAYQSKQQQLRIEQIQSEFDMRQARQRSERLRELMSSIPSAAAVDSRQVVSLEGGGERFLSPAAQLVAVEVAISEAALANIRRDRERVASGLKAKYYCQGREMHQRALLGQDLLVRLGEVHEAVFEGQDLSEDIVEETANVLSLERQEWINYYLDRARFVVPPEGGEQLRRKPGLTLGAVVGIFLGGLFGVLLALLLAWWHDNRAVVVAVEDN